MKALHIHHHHRKSPQKDAEWPPLSTPCSQDDNRSFGSLLSDLDDLSYDVSEFGESSTICRSGRHAASLSEKWTALEESFSFRNRCFRRISESTQSPELRELLWERERAVRNLERAYLLLRHVHSDDEELPSLSTSLPAVVVETKKIEVNGLEDSRDDEAFFDAVSNDAQEVVSTSRAPPPSIQPLPRLTSMRNTVILEWYTTAPTLHNFVLHCLALISFFEFIATNMRHVERVIMAMPLTYAADEENDEKIISYSFYAVCFFLGLLGLRWSGYIHWWAHNHAYNTVKFDLHNQLRLGNAEARAMQFVRRSSALQFAFYFIGYSMCYTSIEMFNEAFYGWLMPNAEWTSRVLLYDGLLLTTVAFTLHRSGFDMWNKF